MNRMDHGPFVSWTIAGEHLTYKGIVIKVDNNPPAAICFDTDLLRMSAGWVGGFLRWYPERDGLEKNPTPLGTVLFSNDAGPGWSATPNFQDPRPNPYGPLPGNWARYRGLYLNGDDVVLSYTVGDAQVLELPGFRRLGESDFFSRTFNLTPARHPLALRLCKLPPGDLRLVLTNVSVTAGFCVLPSARGTRFIGFAGVPQAARWEILDQHLVLTLPPSAAPVRFTAWIGGEQSPPQPATVPPDMAAILAREPLPPDLAPYCQPGRARWSPALITRGRMGTNDGPLIVDTLTVPENNPWHSWIRCTGFDFLPDGRAVVASVSGDVWLVSGIAEQLGDLTWKRFATGLYQPLGVKVVGGQIYVTCRDQVHRLHDRNSDGEADFYENFNNDSMVAENFHEYTMNLETDSAGNFYYTKGAPWPPKVQTAHAGVLFKLSPNGERLESFATGLRGPNGLAIGPGDEIVFSDNEGHWLPTCCLHLAKPGGFFGMKPTAHRSPVPDQFEPPICWIPHAIDNSPGSPVWVPRNSWGPLAGQLLLTSYGKSTLSLVLTETVKGQVQGGLVRLPLQFESGLIRGRFHAADGHLYLCGLRVWQSTGIKYGAFHRLRYTGKPFQLPVGLRVRRDGIELEFGCDLDAATAADPQNYGIQQWNYRWIERYGSPHYSVADPGREGHDTVEITAARLRADRKTVFLDIPHLQPVMQMRIAYRIAAADGTLLRQEIFSTIHHLPP